MYAATVVSSGFFAIVWLILLMRDINELEHKPIYPIRPIAAILAVGVSGVLLSALLLGMSMAIGPISSARLTWIGLTFAVAFAMVVLQYTLLVNVCTRVDRMLGRTDRALRALSIVVLTLLANLGYIVLQLRMNKVLERRTTGDSSPRAAV
jgi:hypothetical protein